MKHRKNAAVTVFLGGIALTLVVLVIFQQMRINKSATSVPDSSIITQDLQACQNNLQNMKQEDERIKGLLADLQNISMNPESEGNFTNLLWQNILQSKDSVLNSPSAPDEGRIYSLKTGESATTMFYCEENSRWTGSVKVVSISKVPGDLLIYQAALELNGKQHNVMVHNPEKSKNTYVIDLGEGPMRVYIIDITSDRIYLANERNAC